MNYNIKSLYDNDNDNGNDFTQRKVVKESSLSRNTLVLGLQCLVDTGASPGMMIGDKETTVYFTVFVLPYSRLMHVSISVQPIDTQTLIY